MPAKSNSELYSSRWGCMCYFNCSCVTAAGLFHATLNLALRVMLFFFSWRASPLDGPALLRLVVLGFILVAF